MTVGLLLYSQEEMDNLLNRHKKRGEEIIRLTDKIEMLEILKKSNKDYTKYGQEEMRKSLNSLLLMIRSQVKSAKARILRDQSSIDSSNALEISNYNTDCLGLSKSILSRYVEWEDVIKEILTLKE